MKRKLLSLALAAATAAALCLPAGAALLPSDAPAYLKAIDANPKLNSWLIDFDGDGRDELFLGRYSYRRLENKKWVGEDVDEYQVWQGDRLLEEGSLTEDAGTYGWAIAYSSSTKKYYLKHWGGHTYNDLDEYYELVDGEFKQIYYFYENRFGDDESAWIHEGWGKKPKNVERVMGYADEAKTMGENAHSVRAQVAAAIPTAYASTQTVTVDGKAVTFQMYALKDAGGNMTNYVKIRDIASVLNGTPAQFEVGYHGMVNLAPGWTYTPNGTEMWTPFGGNRAYTKSSAQTNVGGELMNLDAIVLTDDAGGGYTYYQLRDLGKALGFNVGWTKDRGVFIETDKPYDPAN